MAYKDEVARLYSDGEFEKRVASEFEGDLRVELNLAPLLFARRDPNTGRLRKKAFGGCMVGAMLFLAKFKFLRGTPFDTFGRLPDRGLARALRDEYEATIVEVARDLAQANSDLALRIAALPGKFPGYDQIKADSPEAVGVEREALIAASREGRDPE